MTTGNSRGIFVWHERMETNYCSPRPSVETRERASMAKSADAYAAEPVDIEME